MISTYRLVQLKPKNEVLIPLKGEWNILVKEGDPVKPGTPLYSTVEKKIIASYYLPKELNIKPEEADRYVSRVNGEFVLPKEIIAERVMRGGLSIRTVYSSESGIIDYSRLSQGFVDILSEGNSEDIVSLIDGVVKRIDEKRGIIIESDTLISRRFFFSDFDPYKGTQKIDISGEFVFLGDGSSIYTKSALARDYTDKIVWAGKYVYPELAAEIMERGASAVLTYAMSYADFKSVDFPVVVVGGFGHLQMSLHYLAFWKTLLGAFMQLDWDTCRITIGGPNVGIYSDQRFVYCVSSLKQGEMVRSLDLESWGAVGIVEEVFDEAVAVDFDGHKVLLPYTSVQRFV